MRSILRLSFASGFLLLASYASNFGQDKLKIAIIPKSDLRSHWQSIHAGAQAEGEASGKVEVEWRAPKKDQDLSQQIAIVEQCIEEGMSGIVLAPLDFDVLESPVARAQKKGIPVVIIDSRLKGESGKDYVSFVASDSRNGGMLAAEEMARLIGEKGKVTVLRFDVGQANLTEREEGFIRALGKYKDIQVDAEIRIGKPTMEEVTAAGMSMIDRLKNTDGLFCSSESLTKGMLGALRKANLAGKIKFIGFDTSTPLVEALKKGEINALVAQDPTKMGYFAVKTVAPIFAEIRYNQ